MVFLGFVMPNDDEMASSHNANASKNLATHGLSLLTSTKAGVMRCFYWITSQELFV